MGFEATYDIPVSLPDLSSQLSNLGPFALNVVLDVRFEVLQLDLAILMQDMERDLLENYQLDPSGIMERAHFW